MVIEGYSSFDGTIQRERHDCTFTVVWGGLGGNRGIGRKSQVPRQSLGVSDTTLSRPSSTICGKISWGQLIWRNCPSYWFCLWTVRNLEVGLLAALNLSFLICSVGISNPVMWVDWAISGQMGPGRTPLARKLGLCLLSVTYCWVSNLLLCLPSHWVTASISSVALRCFARDGVLLGPNTQPDGAPAPACLQAELPGVLDFPAVTPTCQIPPPWVHLQTHDAQTVTESSWWLKDNSSKDSHQHEKFSQLKSLPYPFFFWQALDIK